MTKYYKEVPISTPPKVKGWYNMTADSHPRACARAYYDGMKFQLNETTYDWGSLLRKQIQIYWLEEVDIDTEAKWILYRSKIQSLKNYLNKTFKRNQNG